MLPPVHDRIFEISKILGFRVKNHGLRVDLDGFSVVSWPVSGILFHSQTSTINDVYKRLQEYKTSVQPYNGKLQSELATANETRKHVESILRGHYTSLQDQLTSLLLE
ncbi:hypothetical protein LguiA_007604 [Lonicera macranthoides]